RGVQRCSSARSVYRSPAGGQPPVTVAASSGLCNTSLGRALELQFAAGRFERGDPSILVTKLRGGFVHRLSRLVDAFQPLVVFNAVPRIERDVLGELHLCR